MGCCLHNQVDFQDTGGRGGHWVSASSEMVALKSQLSLCIACSISFHFRLWLSVVAFSCDFLALSSSPVVVVEFFGIRRKHQRMFRLHTEHHGVLEIDLHTA